MHTYLKTPPISPAARLPWNDYPAPVLAVLFLWVGFYQALAGGTIDRGHFGLLFVGLVVGACVSFWLFYSVPAKLGMQTGLPVAVLGSSTFGSRGGQVIPGPLAGLLLTVWFGVAVFYAGDLVLRALGLPAEGLTVPFIVVAVAWAAGTAALGCRGGRFLWRLATLVSALLALTLLAVFYFARLGLPQHGLDLPEPYAAFTLTVQLVVAFFATIAIASPALGMFHRGKRDVLLTGLLAIVVPSIFAGYLALLSVAGAKGQNPNIEGFGFIQAAIGLGGYVGLLTPWLLLVGSVPAAAIYASMATDSIGVMLPSWSRLRIVLLVAVGGVVLALSRVPQNLQFLITLTGALAAPVCGITAADYWSHDRRWPHTRPGVNYAGFAAWIIGALVGILPLLPIPEYLLLVAHPSALYAWLAGFVAYVVLGNLGLKPYRKHRRHRSRQEWAEPSPSSAGHAKQPSPQA